jgi:DNA polymerase zeta
MGLSDPGSSPFGPEELLSLSADPRDHSRAGWIHEEEYRQMTLRTVAEEKRRTGGKDINLENFIVHDPFEKSVKTVLESVEDLYPDNNEYSSLQMHQSVAIGDFANAGTYVNENAALPVASDEDSYCSDDDGDIADIFSDGDNNEEEYAADDPLADALSNMPFENYTEPNSRLAKHPSDHNQFIDSEEYQLSTNHPEPPLDRLEYLNTEEKIRKDIQSAERPLKRPESDVTNHGKPNKRPKYTSSSRFSTTNAPYRGWQQYEGDRSENTLKSEGTSNRHSPSKGPPSPSKTTIQPGDRSRGNGQNGRLQFPVIKDPNDPITILRFSQDGGRSFKATQEIADNTNFAEATTSVSKDTSQNESSSLLPSSSTDTKSNESSHVLLELASRIYESFKIHPNSRICCLPLMCPSPQVVSSTLSDYDYPSVIYTKAHYSDEDDVPDRPRDYAGREFRLQGSGLQYLPDFDPSGRSSAMLGEQAAPLRDKQEQEQIDQRLRESTTARIWEFAPVPPSRSEVVEWAESKQRETRTEAVHSGQQAHESKTKLNMMSQIEAPTQKNDYGFKYSQKGKSTSVEHQTQYMSIMSLEVHVNTRGVLSPNPEEDEISCISWCIQSDDEDLDFNSHIPGVHVGMVFQGEHDTSEAKLCKALRIDLEHEPTELDLINRLVDLVRLYDPDIITGYEVHNGSWGYVIERARKKYDFDICDELSRAKSQAHGRFGKDADRWGYNKTSSIRVTGRHVINIWRAMRGELNLLQYSMENVVFHLLHRRVPHYSFRDLTGWYQSGKPRDLLKVVDYFISRVQMNLEILESNELVPRTSEQARLLGIDFFSVFSRGSQFKVESLMFRIAKPENFLLVSPSRKQVGQQNALECLPLVMEPQSDFYTSPLLVLDFQSLYPSIMIAYNYCYSTFLGRVSQWRGRDKMGFTEYNRQPGLLELLKDKINIAPNGMIYAKPEVRKSLLAKMLAEILETRVMVKTGMKMDKDDKVLQRLLNNRQLALKLIANVTYGYTSASFSGRMPCSEIADSIVQSGRETLEKAIALIHSVERWGAEVVYGDTDSLFVYLKGRTRDQAFDIGEEISKAVTEMNPSPIKLKFEKVYHPCVLLAKKRYVGFKYEHRNQKEPEFDAKGIETVRRDGTPAEQKIEEKALKLLFRTADLSQVKRYFQKQCTKILQGQVSIQDFCFAREVKLGTYNERGLPPPGALISTKKMLEDPRQEPQYGERVPYVVVTGAPGSRLIDRCVPPETLLHDAQLDLDAEYYITKNLIPPLERILNLVGANVRQWYDEMPKVQRIRRVEGAVTSTGGKKTLESYMKASTCIVCKAKLDNADVPVCTECMQQPHIALLDLGTRQRQAEKSVSDLLRVCRSCMGVPFGDEVKCDSKDCPVFYSRTRYLAHWRHTKALLDPVVKLLQDKSESDLEW